METFGLLGFVFGMMGVVAFTEVTKLKKEVETIKEAIQKLGGEIDPDTSSD